MKVTADVPMPLPVDTNENDACLQSCHGMIVKSVVI